MSSEPPIPPQADTALPALEPAADVPATLPPVARTAPVSRATVVVLVLLAGGALVSSALLWQRLATIQEQLARQSADTSASAIEARALARQAQEVARDTAARQAVMEARLSEVAMQRAQLEQLMQSLSVSRDENLLVDVESALVLAQQQTQLTGSAEPLLAALRTAEQRLQRAGQPRLARLRAAIARDIDRVKAASLVDVPGVLARLDELVRQVDELPLANAVPHRSPLEPARKPASAPASAPQPAPSFWQRWSDAVLEEARGLVRVSRIDQPEAVLVSPEQAFFLRENLKLKLLNARLSLLARQTEVARADVAAAAASLNKYFDGGARRTQAAATQLQQVQAQLKSAPLPRVDETLAALQAAGAGR
jgi:uroporphyrin-3 C-methyltransferase